LKIALLAKKFYLMLMEINVLIQTLIALMEK